MGAGLIQDQAAISLGRPAVRNGAWATQPGARAIAICLSRRGFVLPAGEGGGLRPPSVSS